MMFATGLEVDIDVMIYWQEMPLYMISLARSLSLFFFLIFNFSSDTNLKVYWALLETLDNWSCVLVCQGSAAVCYPRPFAPHPDCLLKHSSAVISPAVLRGYLLSEVEVYQVWDGGGGVV